MIGLEVLGRALLLAAGVALAAGASAQQATPAAKAAKPAAKVAAKPPPPELEAKAIDLLKAMSAKLAAAKAMSFTAIVTYESPSRIGPVLAYSTLSEVVMQRPDRLRVVTLGDGPASEFYYDGKTMTAFAPAVGAALNGLLPPLLLSVSVLAAGLAFAVFVGVASGFLPGIGAMRLRVVDALRRV